MILADSELPLTETKTVETVQIPTWMIAFVDQKLK